MKTLLTHLLTLGELNHKRIKTSQPEMVHDRQKSAKSTGDQM